MTGANIEYPGAHPPDRQYHIDAGGVRIAIHEWGDAGDPPLMLAHGGFDFARTYDVFAPLLAQGGWRVVSWDHRGCGDSARAHLYSWDADQRDAAAVFEHVAGHRPVPAVGHSKGGAMMLHLIDAQPFRFSRVANIDGIPSTRPTPDVAEHDRTKMLVGEVTGWLDHRNKVAFAVRRPGTIEGLATRRGRMNPRLDHDWLKYLVTVGAYESEDGWRWKLDPAIRWGGFGPWRPEWAWMRLAGIGIPFYGMLATEAESMGWGTTWGEIERYVPENARIDIIDGAGHFIHIERPHDTAERVLEFLGKPQ